MALRIAPAPSAPQQTLSSLGAPSAPGVHDTLRSNLNLSAGPPKAINSSNANGAPQSFHPLESRLHQWRSQQESLKMELLRRQFGIAEPVKRSMELSIVRAGEWRPGCLSGLGGSNLHAEILEGRDAEIGWEDVFTGEDMRDPIDFHVEMETRFNMASW